MRINGLRSLTGVLKGKSLSEEQRRGLSALSALNKMFWSEYHQEVMALAIDVLGPAGQVLSALAKKRRSPATGGASRPPTIRPRRSNRRSSSPAAKPVWGAPRRFNATSSANAY
jgi:hypothetical protein